MANKDKGFASMSPEARRRIASMGGKAAQAAGTGHRWSSESAREAGKKGGRAAQARGRQKREALDASGAAAE